MYTLENPPPDNYRECPDGEIYNFAKMDCEGCPPLQTYVQLAGACLCQAGTFADGDGCTPCPAGTFAASDGTIECKNCTEGTFSPEGASGCDFCAKGSWTNTPGTPDACYSCPDFLTTKSIATIVKSDCFCDINTYGSTATGNGCNKCPVGGTTPAENSLVLTDCMCPTGQLRKKDDEGSCAGCPEGMTCENLVNGRLVGAVEFGSAMPTSGDPAITVPDMQPVLKEFYWASPKETISVFRCASAERCPGGNPGEACGPNIKDGSDDDRACSECLTGWAWDGKKCIECQDVEKTALLYPALPILLVPVIVLILYKLFGDGYAKWGSPQNGCASLGFICLNHYQIITIIRGANLAFPINVANVFDAMKFSSDVSTVFKPQCTGAADFQSMLIMKTLAPIIFAVLYTITWGISQIVGKVTKVPWLAMEPNRTVNGFFSLMFTFFAGIVEMAFTLFKCGPNPNGTSTLIADRSIICEEDDWNGMVAIGVVAVLLWVVGFGSLFARTVFLAPRWFHDPNVQMRWKFLFIKFRPDVHWWALIFIAKGIFLNLGFLFLTVGVSQIYWVMTICLCYVGLSATFRPWRHILVCILDVWAHLCLLMVCSAFTWFARDELEDLSVLDEDMSTMCIIFAVLSLPMVPAIIGHMFYIEKSPDTRQKKVMHMSQLKAGLANVSESSENQFKDFALALPEWDWYYMVQAKNVVLTEFARIKSRSGLSSKALTYERASVALGTNADATKAKDQAAPVDGPTYTTIVV